MFDFVSSALLAKYFMYKGPHTLVVYDNWLKQAQAYWEMSLLLRRPFGCEALFDDVFYLHLRFLARAAKLSFAGIEFKVLLSILNMWFLKKKIRLI